MAWLDKEATIAGPGYDRWLVPPAALAIHLCIGMAYGFSVFWKPLGSAVLGPDGQVAPACAAGATTFGDKLSGTLRALAATDCNWTQFDLGWTYTLFFVFLGGSAAIWGGWLERAGPRKAAVVSTVCWCGGMLLSAIAIRSHQLWLLWLGAGGIGGIGLGLGYISPVSTLIKWFPDRRGMATGLAIMGFGGGAMIGSPLATELIRWNATPTDVGVWPTFVALALVYAVFMLAGAFAYRVPPAGYRPAGWEPPAGASAGLRHVHLRDAHRTPQFWLLWVVLCANVSAGIGVIGAAAPMLLETFGGALVGRPELAYEPLKADPALAGAAAAVGAGFVGLVSLFNIFGRFAWASASDRLGRKATYAVFFALGIVMYGLMAWAAAAKSVGVLAAAFCVVASMYGGAFATIPAYLADLFGTRFVGAIHGRLLTAWSTAGILGPFVVNYLHDLRVAQQVPAGEVYAPIFVALAAMLVAGLVANLLVRPVADRWVMTEAELALEAQRAHEVAAPAAGAPLERSVPVVALAWAAVGVPLTWGVWRTAWAAAAVFGG